MRWDFLSRSSDTLDKKQRQVLQVPCHLRQEPACIGAVSDPVVEGEGKREDLPDGDLPPVDPRAFDDSAEPEDCHVWPVDDRGGRSEEHTSELQLHLNLVCRLLLEKKKKNALNTLVETKKKNEIQE